MAPALDFGLVPVFWKRSKYSAASFLAAVRSLVNFSRTNGSRGIAASKRHALARASRTLWQNTNSRSRQPNMVRPSIRADACRMGAFIVFAIHQTPTGRERLRRAFPRG